MRKIDADALIAKIASLDRIAKTDSQKSLLGRVMYIVSKMPTSRAEPGWISVKDRLPDMLEPFWAACKSLTDDRDNWTIEGIYKGTTFGGPWGVPIVAMGKAEVYAWKPKEIPEPPKEG